MWLIKASLRNPYMVAALVFMMIVLGTRSIASIPLDILPVIEDLTRIDVRNMLGVVPGSVNPVVIGGKDRTILVYLEPNKLQARNLSPVDVVKALKEGNVMMSPGTAYFGDSQFMLDTNGMVRHVEDLNDLPIRIQAGSNVYLRDIGHAEDSYAIQTSRVRINGRQQVYVPIYRQGGASTLAVSDDTKKALPAMEERLEPGTKLKFVMDQSVYVRQAIESLVEEGFIGIILVAV